MATKYKEYFQNMLEEHKDMFDGFRPVHDKYTLDMHAHQEEFNEKGASVMEIIRDWEDRLCGRSEGSGYGSFTGGLAEKFMDEVRKEFPMIDRVGIIMSKPAVTPAVESEFELSKINSDFTMRKIDL